MEEGSPGVFLKTYRSMKRVRVGDDCTLVCDMDDQPNPSLMEHVMSESEQGPMPNSTFRVESFRDKLMNKVNLEKNVGVDISSLDANYDDLNDDEDVQISQGERGPSIQFSDRAKDRLCKPWRNALIVKLLGKSHTYNYIHARLQQKWSLKGAWKLVDLVNDYYVVKFDLEEDLNFVLTGGPWIIAGQYLVMQKWRPGFCPTIAHITHMAAWLRVSAIQLECFDVWSLKRIDLTKPLEAFVQINQNWYNIEYEGLPDICYHCGRYGHKRENCELRVKVPADVNTESIVGDDSDKMKTDSAGASVNNDPLADSGLRGPWMNVQSCKRSKPDFKAYGGKGSSAKVKVSRFDALRNLSDNFGRDEVASDVFVEQDKSNFNSSFLSDVEHGKKVWTKTKNAKPVLRSALNDISNKPFEGKVLGDMSFKKGGGPSNVSAGTVTRIGKMVVQGKKFDCSSPVNDQITSWVTNQKSHYEKGVYIFGHQPPNISEKDANSVGSTDSKGDEDTLNSNISDSLCQADKMDLLEGQVNLCGGNLAGNTFSDGGGMTVGI
ncbi:unnamed protein product [Prunus armeniaca]